MALNSATGNEVQKEKKSSDNIFVIAEQDSCVLRTKIAIISCQSEVSELAKPA